MSASATASQTLLIYGSFSAGQAERILRQKQPVVVLEMDVLLPERLRPLAAAIVPQQAVPESASILELHARAESLLDAFLEERLPRPGLLTHRLFRAAALNIDGLRMLVPHLSNLDLARRLLAEGPWSKIVVSPGAGVSLRAWQQMGEKLRIPVEILPFDRPKPPFLWLLKRRFQRWQLKRRSSAHSTLPAPRFRLPLASPGDALLCADEKLEPLLGAEGQQLGWKRAPDFQEVDAAALARLRQAYADWFQAWWQDWQKQHGHEDPLADDLILEHLGQWFSRDLYPRFALLIEQARQHLTELKPRLVLISAMRGRQELLWAMAAREQGIPVASYTFDDGIFTQLSFMPDYGLCDDRRQVEVAQQGGMPDDRVIKVHSHRYYQAGARPKTTRVRPRVLLAETFYSGHSAASPPLISAWSIATFIAVARQLPECDFVIKFHPLRERPDAALNYIGFHHLHHWTRERAVAERKPPANLQLLAPEVRLSDYLTEHVDVLVNIESYAAFEAYSAGVPVITLTQPLPGIAAYAEMTTLGVVQQARDVTDMVALIRRNLHDNTHIRHQTERQRQYLDFFYGVGDPTLLEAASQLGQTATILPIQA